MKKILWTKIKPLTSSHWKTIKYGIIIFVLLISFYNIDFLTHQIKQPIDNLGNLNIFNPNKSALVILAVTNLGILNTHAESNPDPTTNTINNFPAQTFTSTLTSPQEGPITFLKTVTPSTVPVGQMVGQTLTYSISFQNTANAEATNIVIKDPIPIGTSYVVGSATNGGQYANGEITWTLTNLAANSSLTVSFKVKIFGGPPPPP